MKKKTLISFIAAAFALAASGSDTASGDPQRPVQSGEPQLNQPSAERLGSTPDLMQTLPEASLPDGGGTYCAPVAVSNSFVWLSHHGYPNIALLGGADTPQKQGRLARKLGEYMGSSSGTTPYSFLVGISHFLADTGYKIDSLKYEGWEEHPKEFSQGVEKPDPNFIKTGLEPNSAAWLMIGWYKYSKETDKYHPYDQHWVTVVGFGQDKQGKPDPNIIIIHDPAERSGKSTSHDYVVMEKLTHGTFASSRTNSKASGWYKLKGDLKVKKGADCGILDGVVVLHLKGA